MCHSDRSLYSHQVCKSTTEFPWCDYTLSAEARAAMVVKQLTDDEKAGLLTNGASAVPRINWPAYNWCDVLVHSHGHTYTLHTQHGHNDTTLDSDNAFSNVHKSLIQSMYHVAHIHCLCVCAGGVRPCTASPAMELPRRFRRFAVLQRATIALSGI